MLSDEQKENERLHRQNTVLLGEKLKAESEAKEWFNACAERDKRIAELADQSNRKHEENERAFKQVILQMQDSIDFLQKKLNASNAENRPLSDYEFDEIG